MIFKLQRRQLIRRKYEIIYLFYEFLIYINVYQIFFLEKRIDEIDISL